MSITSRVQNLISPPVTDMQWHATDPWIRFGMRTVTVMFGAIAVMSLLPISGAVVTTGVVAVEGEYQTVQHLEGGIVSKILVRNGDAVKKGDVLLRIDSTQARASMSATSGKVADYAIQEARLIAERDRKDGFAAPVGIDVNDPPTAKILNAQTSLFDARRTAYLGQQKILNQRLSQSESDLKGLESQLTARLKERDLNAKELATVMPLFEKGYVNQQRIGPLQREQARLEGEIGNLKSERNKLKSARAEVEARLAQIDKDYVQNAAEDLQKVQAGLAEQRETEKSVGDRLSRTDVRAPVDGIIHALQVSTEGGVIQPGHTVLQIVPTGRDLLIEARVAPKDIDTVYISQTAAVRFTSFDSHTTPRLEGRVRKVSAAEIADKDGKTYFTAQVEVPPAEIAKLTSAQHLIPGMPAEIYIETRSRTVLSYFLKPLTDMMARTFRET
ncbi:MAG: HlyD family type I secretion periplasmic adaptor subunit [Hyphomicrobium sp.]